MIQLLSLPFSMTANSQLGVFKLKFNSIKQNKEFSFSVVLATFEGLSAQWAHVANGCYTGQS